MCPALHTRRLTPRLCGLQIDQVELLLAFEPLPPLVQLQACRQLGRRRTRTRTPLRTCRLRQRQPIKPDE